MRPGIIITARINSSRLPGKVLMPFLGKTLLEILNDRVDYVHKHCREIFQIYVPTVFAVPLESGYEFGQLGHFFEGDELDVRDRVIQCAEKWGIDPVIRITGDCPFVDERLIRWDLLPHYFGWAEDDADCGTQIKEKKTPHDLVGLACGEFAMEQGGNCYPEGVDAEIVSLAALKDFGDEQDGDREHVTQHIKRRGNYRLLRPDEDWSDVKLSIDTMEDYRQACLIAGRVGINAGWREIAECARWWKGQQ